MENNNNQNVSNNSQSVNNNNENKKNDLTEVDKMKLLEEARLYSQSQMKYSGKKAANKIFIYIIVFIVMIILFYMFLGFFKNFMFVK